jgi:hypothetical protein
LMSISDRWGSHEICVVDEELHVRKGETSDVHSCVVFRLMRNQFLQVNLVHIFYVSSGDLPFSNPATFSNLTVFFCRLVAVIDCN